MPTNNTHRQGASSTREMFDYGHLEQIIQRQKWTKYQPGEGLGSKSEEKQGKNDMQFVLVYGIIRMHNRREKKMPSRNFQLSSIQVQL